MSYNEARDYHSAIPQRTRRSVEQEQPKRLVRVKSSWITPGEKILMCIFGVCMSLALIFIVSYNANIDSLNRDLQTLEQEIGEQYSVNENLNYQVMEYSNPERILAIAKENGLNIQNTQVRQALKMVE